MMTVFVLTHHYENGTGVSTYSTHARAMKAAAANVADWARELDDGDVKQEVAKAINAQDYEEAVAVLEKYTFSEWFEIVETEVDEFHYKGPLCVE
jgi:cobalamin biosynthesis protein CbiD